MDYGQTKDSQLLPGTITTIGLLRPTIRGLLKWTNMTNGWITKIAVDCKSEYIVNMTKPVTNRH